MKLNTVNDDKSYVQLDLAFARYKAEDKSRTLTLTLGLKLTLGLESEKCHFQWLATAARDIRFERKNF